MRGLAQMMPRVLAAEILKEGGFQPQTCGRDELRVLRVVP
jgi:hypothetical protein